MSHKLLLADDSVTIQRVVELTFSGEDVDVVAVGDGEQAIARIPTEHPDIVLADIGMPKRTGYEVATFVKGHPDLKHIPVLLLAGAFEPVDDARAKEVGCDGVLVKPLEPQQVIARVRELLDGKKPYVTPAPPPRPEPAEERTAPSRTLEFSRAVPDSSEPSSDRQLPADAPDDPPADRVDSSVTAGIGPEESLDDYFDRLDAAFASLDTPPLPASDSRAVDLDDEEEVPIPTMDDLLGSGFDTPPPSIDVPVGAHPGRPLASAGVPVPPVAEPPDLPPALGRDAAADAAGSARSVIAEAFTQLLAVEQQEPGARPVRLSTGPSEPIITDALVDEITRRVLARIGPDAVRHVVADIVSEISERLVREEIARIRGK